MTKIAIAPNASGTGTFTIAAPNSNTDRTFSLPDATGEVLTDQSDLAGVAGVGKVLQVVSTTKTDTTSFTSTASNTFQDISGMSVSITPTSATSKILVLFTIQVSQSAAASIHVRLVRDSTAISVGNAAGNRLQSTVMTRPAASPYEYDSQNLAANFLDSPATTSAVVYKLQATLGATYTGSFFLNRVRDDVNLDYGGRPVSTITVMEIAG